MWCCWASKHQHGNTDHRSPRTSSHINCCMTSSGEGVRCCAAELPPLLLSWTNPARKLPAPHSAYEWCSHAIRNLPLLNGQRRPFISRIGTDLTDSSSLSVAPLPHCHQRCSASCCTAEMRKQKWSMGRPNSPACGPAFTTMVAEDR